MGNEMMNMEELAAYIRRDVREVGKLASRGHLPGQKVSGEWRFARAEINQWLESQLGSYSDEQLAALESSPGATLEQDLLLAEYLAESSVAVPLMASTRSSVLQELVKLAEQSWHIYDPDELLGAIRSREQTSSTALPGGVAIPHPHRPLPTLLGETVLAFGRTHSGIPFGGPQGDLTDIFFLVCCRDDKTHLRILARLSRLIMRPHFLDSLRETETASEAHALILQSEQELVNES